MYLQLDCKNQNKIFYARSSTASVKTNILVRAGELQATKLSPQDKILVPKIGFLPNFYYLYTRQSKPHPIGLCH